MKKKVLFKSNKKRIRKQIELEKFIIKKQLKLVCIFIKFKKKGKF